MRKIILFLLGITIWAVSSAVLAACDPAAPMTSPNYCISLGNMDPMGASHAGPGTGTTGMQAIFVILEGVSRLLLFMIPVIAIVSTLIAGYYYIFSAGDSEKANKAKTIIKWNIIAIIVALMSWSIIQLIASLFSS